jgi:hypothetical protein
METAQWTREAREVLRGSRKRTLGRMGGKWQNDGGTGVRKVQQNMRGGGASGRQAERGAGHPAWANERRRPWQKRVAATPALNAEALPEEERQ